MNREKVIEGRGVLNFSTITNNQTYPKSHLITEVLGECPHPLAGIRGQDLFDGLKVHSYPTDIMVLFKAHDLITGGLQRRKNTLVY